MAGPRLLSRKNRIPGKREISVWVKVVTIKNGKINKLFFVLFNGITSLLVL